MSYPLYDLFKQKSEAHASKGTLFLSQEEMKICCERIKKLDQDGKEKLYTLIRYAAKLANESTVYNASYKKTKLVSKVIFGLTDFPPLLQRICYLFVEQHLETMQSPEEVEIVFE
jgi:hypothetical protein